MNADFSYPLARPMQTLPPAGLRDLFVVRTALATLKRSTARRFATD